VSPSQSPSQSPPSRPPGSLRVGTIGGVDVYVRSSWIVVAILIAGMLAPAVERAEPGLGAFKYVAGLAFAVLLYLSILLHEMSHAVVARRFGLTVRAINLEFLGGFTEIEGEPATPGQEFRIAVVGPLTSLLIGGVSLGLLQVLHGGLVELTVGGLAGANLVLGVLNLVPGLPLDGGRVLRAAVWQVGGNVHRGTIVAGWGGRVAALLVLLWPALRAQIGGRSPDLIDYILACVVAGFLWTGATASMTSARIRRRLPALQARPLARRVVVVADTLTVSEAVLRAHEVGAGGIVVTAADGRLSAVVNESALVSTPEERRPWMLVGSVARSLQEGLVLPADVTGEDLVRAMARTPASEYVLVEQDGSVFGLLATADVDAAFEATARR
jgi:Zn-dependent protease